jgi:hypothetical protein
MPRMSPDFKSLEISGKPFQTREKSTHGKNKFRLSFSHADDIVDLSYLL